MSHTHQKPITVPPQIVIERVQTRLKANDLSDLCDAADAAILAGGGFGWVRLPMRDVMERYWHGVMAVPYRILLVARLEGVIAGSLQLVRQPENNEAQQFSISLRHHFTAPWARGAGVAKALLVTAEGIALDEGYEVINLDVRETQTAAIGLYESQNYQLIGTHPAYAKIKDKLVKGLFYYKMFTKS